MRWPLTPNERPPKRHHLHLCELPSTLGNLASTAAACSARGGMAMDRQHARLIVFTRYREERVVVCMQCPVGQSKQQSTRMHTWQASACTWLVEWSGAALRGSTEVHGLGTRRASTVYACAQPVEVAHPQEQRTENRDVRGEDRRRLQGCQGCSGTAACSAIGMCTCSGRHSGEPNCLRAASRSQPLLATDQPMQMGGFTPAIARMAAGTVQIPSPAIRPARGASKQHRQGCLS